MILGFDGNIKQLRRKNIEGFSSISESSSKSNSESGAVGFCCSAQAECECCSVIFSASDAQRSAAGAVKLNIETVSEKHTPW